MGWVVGAGVVVAVYGAPVVAWARKSERVRRDRRNIVWMVQHDLSGVLAAVGILVAVGAALVAAGFVDLENPGAFYVGLGLMVLGLFAAVGILCIAVAGRIGEERYRHRLTTFASNGRQFLTRLVTSAGTDFPGAEISTWEEEVRGLLNEMDPTGVYVQRFDIAAGLPTVDYRFSDARLGEGSPPGDAARSLSFRLVRLSEFMRESQR